MRITKLDIKNFRSVVDLNLSFPYFYTALCGRNDSGKTNLIRGIQAVFAINTPPYFEEDGLSLKQDLPTWLQKDDQDHAISISVTCRVDPNHDAGLHLFLNDYLKLSKNGEFLLTLTSTCSRQAPDGQLTATIEDHELTSIQAQEVRNKMRSVGVVLFHNSTQLMPSFFRYRNLEVLETVTGEDRLALDKAKKKINAAISKAATNQQKGLSDLLGRFKDQYKVGVSVSDFDPAETPLGITLGEDEVALENWGSGTQNRTRILQTIFRARRLSESETSAAKVTPILVIEEPESFLHPSAQAEFGKLLQDLANEFQIQVLVATHSPYMLSSLNPESNILLERTRGKKSLGKSIVANTKDENWMEPFGLALGLSNDQFEPWRKVLFHGGDAVVLVEGQTDQEYFKLMQQEQLGNSSLSRSLEIVPYGGKDSIKNPFFLKFFLAKMKHCFITFDLDAEKEVLAILECAGFRKNINCFALGSEHTRSIEGLLPEVITKAVQTKNPELTNALAFGDKLQKSNAKNNYKKALLEEFKRSAKFTDEYFRGFYTVISAINKTLAGRV